MGPAFSTQPVDKSGEKLGGTGGQPGKYGGEDADNQARRPSGSQPSNADTATAHIICGRGSGAGLRQRRFSPGSTGPTTTTSLCLSTSLNQQQVRSISHITSRRATSGGVASAASLG